MECEVLVLQRRLAYLACGDALYLGSWGLVTLSWFRYMGSWLLTLVDYVPEAIGASLC
jgi:hypothetical protein